MDQLRPELTRSDPAGPPARSGHLRRGLPGALLAALLAVLPGCGPAPPPVLSGGFASAEEAARRALALIEAGDAEGLRELALSEAEFRELVYPELPASRPERNTSAEFLWEMLDQRSRNSLAFTLDRYAGQPLQLLRVDFVGETTDYGGFRVHRDTALTVRRGGGPKAAVRLFGAMIEQDGRFKIFSFVAD